jgi:hypothetical protein
LRNTKEKVRNLEVTLREAEAGGYKLKRAMKETAASEYVVSQMLAYEKRARWGLEVEFEVVLKLLHNDQVTIAGYEVELNDLKSAASYAMDNGLHSSTDSRGRATICWRSSYRDPRQTAHAAEGNELGGLY